MDPKQKQQNTHDFLMKTLIHAAIAVVYMFIFALLSQSVKNKFWLVIALIALYLATMAAVYFFFRTRDGEIELSAEEIARELGISQSAVRKRKERGLRMLRERMEMI